MYACFTTMPCQAMDEEIEEMTMKEAWEKAQANTITPSKKPRRETPLEVLQVGASTWLSGHIEKLEGEVKRAQLWKESLTNDIVNDMTENLGGDEIESGKQTKATLASGYEALAKSVKDLRVAVLSPERIKESKSREDLDSWKADVLHALKTWRTEAQSDWKSSVRAAEKQLERYRKTVDKQSRPCDPTIVAGDGETEGHATSNRAQKALEAALARDKASFSLNAKGQAGALAKGRAVLLSSEALKAGAATIAGMPYYANQRKWVQRHMKEADRTTSIADILSAKASNIIKQLVKDTIPSELLASIAFVGMEKDQG